MKREFLRNLKVGETALPDVVIDAIIEEHQRDLDAVKANPGANGGSGEKTFTQEEVNRIVSDRLARERDKSAQQPQEGEREKALKAREARLDCRDYLDSKKYPLRCWRFWDALIQSNSRPLWTPWQRHFRMRSLFLQSSGLPGPVPPRYRRCTLLVLEDGAVPCRVIQWPMLSSHRLERMIFNGN